MCSNYATIKSERALKTDADKLRSNMLQMKANSRGFSQVGISIYPMKFSKKGRGYLLSKEETG
jgi:CHASE3 domain sensor protein